MDTTDTSVILAADPQAGVKAQSNMLAVAQQAQELRIKGQALQNQNMLQQALSNPASYGPDGNITPQALRAVTAADPKVGMQIREDQISDQVAKAQAFHYQTESGKIRFDQLTGIAGTAYDAYKGAKDKGASEQDAVAAGVKARNEAVKQTGGVLSDADIKGIESQPFDPVQVHAFALANKEYAGVEKQGEANVIAKKKEDLAEERERREAKQGQEKINIQIGKAGLGGDNDKVNAVYGAMADLGVAFPPGMRSIKAQRDTINGLLKAHPDDSAVQIAQRVKSGELRLKGEQTELNTVARREGSSAAAIEALNQEGGLYDQLLDTGKKIDFGSAKFKNSLELWKQGAVVADPDISEYVNTLADTRAEFASVLARGGQVTDSVRIASEHAFPDKMSYDELKRNVERSKKIAESIQAGNTAVADAIIKGKSLDEALKESKKSGGEGVQKNDKGWVLHKDKNGNQAYVSPDGKQFEELK